MEQIPQQKKPISPEEFFNDKIEIYHVTRDNFFKLVKERNPSMDEDKILQAKGINFEMNGKVVILMRTDIYPEEYLPYLETHEKWEAYIARKDGFNLWDRSIRTYKNDKGIKDFDEESTKKFFKELEIYNYDFRHEYAIYKEYQQALNDGKLDEYHKWFMDLREKEKLDTSNDNLKLIKNDTEIRESIYKKLKEGAPHVFMRNTSFDSAENLILKEDAIEMISESRKDGMFLLSYQQSPIELASDTPIGNGGSKEVYEIKINNQFYALAIPHVGIDDSHKILEKWQTVLKEPTATEKIREMGFYANDFMQTIPITINEITFPSLIMKRYKDLPFEVRDSKNQQSSIGTTKSLPEKPIQEDVMVAMKNITQEIKKLVQKNIILNKDSFNLCFINSQPHIYFNDLGTAKFENINKEEYDSYIERYTSFAINAFVNGITDEEYKSVENNIDFSKIKESIKRQILDELK